MPHIPKVLIRIILPHPFHATKARSFKLTICFLIDYWKWLVNTLTGLCICFSLWFHLKFQIKINNTLPVIKLYKVYFRNIISCNCLVWKREKEKSLMCVGLALFCTKKHSFSKKWHKVHSKSWWLIKHISRLTKANTMKNSISKLI